MRLAWQGSGSPCIESLWTSYGGFFWLNKDGFLPLPKDAYWMDGAGGQRVFIVPSHDLVIVRLGFFKGENTGIAALNKTFSLLIEAIPEQKKPEIK